MTHDELLAKLNRTTGYISERMVWGNQWHAALLAVVELHVPYQHEVVSYVFCRGCTIDLDLAPPYPCETIQAIEKELQ
jgi:hypothetical protein